MKTAIVGTQLSFTESLELPRQLIQFILEESRVRADNINRAAALNPSAQRKRFLILGAHIGWSFHQSIQSGNGFAFVRVYFFGYCEAVISIRVTRHGFDAFDFPDSLCLKIELLFLPIARIDIGVLTD